MELLKNVGSNCGNGKGPNDRYSNGSNLIDVVHADLHHIDDEFVIMLD